VGVAVRVTVIMAMGMPVSVGMGVSCLFVMVDFITSVVMRVQNFDLDHVESQSKHSGDQHVASNHLRLSKEPLGSLIEEPNSQDPQDYY
jgi:hypothetical protein